MLNHKDGVLATYQGGNVFGPQLSLDMRVVELADKGVRPGLTGVHCDVHVVLPMPLPSLLLAAVRMKPVACMYSLHMSSGRTAEHVLRVIKCNCHRAG